MPDPISAGAKPVIAAVTDAAAATAASSAASAAAASVVDEVAEVIAPAVGAAVKGSVSKAGWVTLSAGAAGLVLNLYNTWKSANETGKQFQVGSIFGATTVAIGAGAGLFMLGEKTALTAKPFYTSGLKGAGIALVLGGIAGAVMGAVASVGSSKRAAPAPGSSSWQDGSRFEAKLPAAPASLRGIKIGTADVITGMRDPKYVQMYVDPTTAEATPEGSSLGDAIAIARREAQSDDQFRSFAVIKTDDEQLWTVRLSGELDQIDGMNYTKDNMFNASYDPSISKHQQTLQAIAGVEELYVFPENADSTSPVQDPGDIPWLVPDVPGMRVTSTTTPPATTTAPAAPSTSSTPAAPSTDAATAAAE